MISEKSPVNNQSRTAARKAPEQCLFSLLIVTCSLLIFSCITQTPQSKTAPLWLTALEKAYPSREWVAVTAEGTSQPQAEAQAMNALARAFRTDITSLIQASQKYSEIVDKAANNKNITFNENKNFSQEVNTHTSIKGLIGVQVDIYRAADRAIHVNARMNRAECAARYSGIIRENAAIINTLLASAASKPQASFDAYALYSYAHSIAQITDNFQSILEVLDAQAVNRKPNYGTADAVKAKMLDCAALITIGIDITTEQPADKTLITRAAASFFSDLGFKTNEQNSPGTPGAAIYTLRANARFETITQSVISCRYYLDAALVNRNGTASFAYTEDDRKAHPDTASEARRLALRAVETSFKEGRFANEFNSWLFKISNEQ
ncbi:MAG: hypothetical protein LBH43_03065 [Treponema sp.]|jgi:hypothetical protein|nr:hypothetical protein [Treponema sp.]